MEHVLLAISADRLQCKYHCWDAVFGVRNFPPFVLEAATASLEFKFPRSIVGHVPDACGFCGKSEVDDLRLRKCGACQIVRYCSEICQKDSWVNGQRKYCGKDRMTAIARDAESYESLFQANPSSGIL